MSIHITGKKILGFRTRIKHRIDQNKRRRKQLRYLSYEQLEARALLSADLVSGNPPTLDDSSNASINISWFESFNDVARVPLASLASVDQTLPEGVSGPIEPAVGEWIVQLADSAATSLSSLSQANSILNEGYGDFTIIRGLGTPGSLLVRGQGATSEFIESRLSENKNVISFSLNSIVRSTSVPNDSRFSEMTNLNNTGQSGNTIDADIDAPEAWDVTKGSTSIVVGVIDSGIDVTHPDLFLNVWLNQGEIPATFRNVVGKPVDIDGDGLVTFYDLNNLRATATGFVVASSGVAATSAQLTTQTPFSTGVNAAFVRDVNGNGRIDAVDIIKDINWAQGIDNDSNSFVDDFFGWNFGNPTKEPFDTNEPLDVNGHGTHVAGTIGAVGNNLTGVVGINWRTSLMALKFLDENNQGDTASAIAAVNYATMMRNQGKANVRVLNNSWGQPSNADPALNGAISAANEAGILFVAAAGNGNILGQSVDNDRTPYYPASFEQPNVISVTASDSKDLLAPSYNFGRVSVDLAAPGVGVLSTYPNSEYGLRSGTSMAAPHVAGAAALIFAQYPDSTVAEVKQAILTSVDPIVGANLKLATGGRLNVDKAIRSGVFAPSARLDPTKPIVITKGATSTEFTVIYTDRDGINAATIDNDDLIVTRQWGPSAVLPVTLKSKIALGNRLTAVYELQAPGGPETAVGWDPLDFGEYVITTVAGNVASPSGRKTEAREVGSFSVKVIDPLVYYVNSFADSLDPGTLRRAIQDINATTAASTIIIDKGIYPIRIAPVTDAASTFGTALKAKSNQDPGGWSNNLTGDWDILGNVTIFGDTNDETILDAQGLDRLFKVHPSGKLSLNRLTLRNGAAFQEQNGGAILSLGDVDFKMVNVVQNESVQATRFSTSVGGGLAAWGGNVSVATTWFDRNIATIGGAVFVGGDARGQFERSTFSQNQGGGFTSHSSEATSIVNSTFSANDGGEGAVSNFGTMFGNYYPKVSQDGRYIVFESLSGGLVAKDTDAFQDIYVFDTVDKKLERVSVDDNGIGGDGNSNSAVISGNGRFVAFMSRAKNFKPALSPSDEQMFVYDRQSKTIKLVLDANVPSIASQNYSPGPLAVSNDGTFVAFSSGTFVSQGGIEDTDVYVKNMLTGVVQKVNQSAANAVAITRNPSMSSDGNWVVFDSSDDSLQPNDSNGRKDVYLFNRTLGTTKRLSVPAASNLLVGDSFSPVISGNGNVIAFVSDARLTSTDIDFRQDIYIYNRLTDSLSYHNVSSPFERYQGDDPLSMSDDGRYLVYLSQISIPNNSFARGVVLHDLSTGQSKIVSSPTGVVPNGQAFGFSISGDGKYVTFSSDASNITPQDLNGRNDIFVYDVAQSSLSRLPIPGDRVGTISVSQSTIAHTANAFYSVAGDVQLDNTLFVKNLTRSVSRNELSSRINYVLKDVEASKVDSLKRINDLPPVHRLLSGNVVIDLGEPAKSGTVDQLGTTRTVPDLGAVEAATADVQGVVFADFNRNGIRDGGEPEVSNVNVVLSTKPISQNSDVPTETHSVPTNEVFSGKAGEFRFTDLSPGNFYFTPVSGSFFKSSEATTSREHSNFFFEDDPNGVSYDFQRRNVAYIRNSQRNSQVYVLDSQTKQNRLISANTSGQPGNGFSMTPRISGDGNIVTFISTSTDFSSGGTGNRDVFVADLNASSIVRIPVIVNGNVMSGNASDLSISEDGRFVAFVWDKGLNFTSVYVYDRNTGTLDMVSPTIDGQELTGRARKTSISRDGNIVAFHSTAGNLDSQDTAFFDDVFYFNRTTRVLTRVKSSLASPNPNGNSSEPYVNGDGRFIAFTSGASNLVAGDDATLDIFVYEIASQSIIRVSRGLPLSGTLEISESPAISSDGNYVVFTTALTNVNIYRQDVYVWSRETNTVALASRTENEGVGDSFSNSPIISGDGRFIGFGSAAANLVQGDTINSYERFVTSNPFLPYSKAASLRAGDLLNNFDIGVIPQAGSITGRVFVDTLLNGTFDDSERQIDRATVFLDMNENGFLDIGEQTTETGVDGLYRFDNVDALQRLVVALRAPAGFSIVSPNETSNTSWAVVLSAGQNVVDRDFALRANSATGQSQNSSVDGIAFRDNIRNGVYDAATDTLLPNTTVFLDQAPFDGVWKNPERRTTTDANGRYTFSGLGAQIVNVVAEIGATATLISPKGSVFEKASEKLFPTKAVSTQQIQAMVSANFDGDAFPDLAVTVSDGDKISIRLNDGNGGFASRQIDIPLPSTGRGRGPIALQAGRFNNNSLTDLAVVNYFDSTIVIMLDFNGNDFASKTSIPVGTGPIDIAAGNFNNDAFIDLAVANSLSNTVSILLNNGSGGFTVSSTIPSGGLQPISIAVGHFNDDNADGFNRDGDRLDIAVANKNGQLATPGGGVSIFRGDGIGGFTLSSKLDAGPNPVDMVVADFDLDAKNTPDIAVNNQGALDVLTRTFSADQINVFPGSVNGTFGSFSAAVGTTGGTIDLIAVDVESDGDIDLVSSNSINGDVSIFRNTKKQSLIGAPLRFEPSEVIGLARLPLAQRNPIAAIDVDNSGTTDIVVIALIDVPNSTGTTTIKTPGINVLKNRATSGVHRVSLDGTNSVPNLNFATFSTAPRPFFNSLSDPNPIPEDAGTQTITITGVTGATGLQFSAVSSNPSIIPNPSVTYTGGTNPATMQYAAAANAFGTAIITVRATNPGSGTTVDAGVFERSFTITVSPVNDKPTVAFPIGKTVTVNEDAGSQIVAGFVNGITVGGGALEATQILQPLAMSASNPSLFQVQPAIDATGRLTFTGAANANGTSIVTLTIKDNGGNIDGGSDTHVELFTIVLNAVNDPPAISIGGNQSALINSGAKTVTGFATGFLPGGGADEATQTVIGYQVTNDNPSIFASQPAIDLNGVLRYTPSATLFGTANVNVRVRDSGGTVNGGIDLSATKSFSITVQSLAAVIDTIDFATLGSRGMTIFGAEVNDQSGYSVSSAGDVNGDGFDDLIIGARYGDALNNTKANAGETYIVFGKATPPASVDLATLGTAGVTIFGTDTADQNGRSVSSAGDVNGDGFDDLIVGSLSASATGNLKLSAGESYVIFGKAVLPSTIDLATLGTAGVTILGVDPSDTSGRSLSSAGDVNGDGFDDLIIGADLADASANAKADAGESYLIFGAATLPTTLDLALLSATAGVRIFGADAGDRSGLSVSSAGDINADGFDDLIVGAFGADASANSKALAGDIYAIYGAASLPPAIDLAVLGSAGITIFGADANDQSGRSVSGAGDVNGDGFDDILIGAFGGDASANAKSAAGDSYVLFGGATLPSTLDLANLGTAGIRIFGAEANDLSGISVSNAGDINADGFDDLLLGAQGASSLNNTRISAGESYVIFGRSFLPSTIDIANFASVGGLMLLGIDRADSSGNSVSNAGDVNGDGFDDLIVGAFIADSVGNARLNAGESYVIFGGNGFTASITHPGTPIAETLTGTVNPDVMVGGNGNDIVIGNGGADVISGGQGNDILAVSDLNFKRIVGGTGNDTLRLDGGNLLLNLTTLRDNRLLDIETIDLTGSGNNSLILKQRDVLNLSSSSNTLTVRGNTGDRLEMEPGWVRTASQVVGVDTFLVFTRGAAILRVTLPVVVQITMDLASLGAAGTTIFGAEANDQSGFSVSNAGDVNGDGFEDMIIGARYGDGFGNTKANAGESYLVYGSPSLPSTIDLLNLGSAGITFIGAEAGDNSGHSVSSAGDINGDGFSDLLVGAISGDAIGNTKASAGDSYVIFGGATLPALINIASLATPSGVPGVILVGGDANDTSGRSVSSAGDVNADGFDDLIIGANGADASGNLKADAGESYIVFGAATLPTVINFASLGTAGVTIFGADAGDQSGFSVNNAGDVNGDGFDDLIIGAFAADASGNAKLASGDSYVVFGGPALPSTINLASLGTAGFTIFGAEANDSSGRSVSSAGDVNGDGFDDILVGAHAADALNNTKLSAGDSYLIYGRAIPPASIDLSALGTAGITIYGVDTNDGSGISVSSAGDVNGDGLDDLIIGAWAADALGNAQPDAGDSYVIFGSATLPTTIDLATFGTVGGASGFSIYGAGRSDLSGNSVSSAGDVNGDGFDDLIIGAFLGDGLNNLKTDSGESYVLFGSNSFTSSVTHLGTSNSETITGTAGNNVMNGGRGNDTLIGSGGADFLNGGQGNDVLAVSDMNFKRINGGTGSDTLRLDGSGLTLNLTSLRDNRLLGIETIDITGSGNNTLVLDKREVLNLSDESNTLIVRRNTGDVVTMGSGWVQGANQTINSVVFNVFTQGAATLKIAADTPPLAPQARLAAIESEAPNIEPVTDEVIYIMPSPRQNATNRFDVNKDGSISPVDVLVVINALRRYGSASDVLTMIELPEGDFDVDGDFSVSPIDVLQVINRMNRRVLSIENTPAPPSSADENSNIASPPSSLPSNAPALGEIDMSLFESQTAEPQTEESTADTSAFAVTTQEPDNALSSATSSEFDAEQLLLTEELINSILDPMSSLSASPDVNLAESVDAYFAVN